MKTEFERISEIMYTLLAHKPVIDVPYEKINDIAVALVKEGYGNISEYEVEIERLKADYAKLQTNAEILARGVRDLNHENYELTEKIKQAQIDVLCKLKQRSWCDNFFADGKWHRYVFVNDIDKLIEEVQNDK